MPSMWKLVLEARNRRLCWRQVERAAVVLCAALCGVVAAQVAMPPRTVNTPELRFRGPVWPAGPVVTKELEFRGAAAPSRAVSTPSLDYRGPVWPTAAIATAPLVYAGAPPSNARAPAPSKLLLQPPPPSQTPQFPNRSR